MARSTRRSIKAWRAAPPPVRVLASLVALLAAWAAANWIYQAIRKPTELFFPVSGALAKAPAETWRSYAPLFNEHSTAIITPELLAALAQVEGAGNPLARTYWRWRPARNPFKVYQPASSAVGMYQMTDATFREAKRYCIHDHVAVEIGGWLDPASCWFNVLYSRVVPTHAIEMTSALLDRLVADAIERHRAIGVTRQRLQDLAAVIHLCGPMAGEAYVAHAFRLSAGQRCGDHDVGTYLAQVNAMKRQFARMAAEE
ncbi:MAG TPA: lytic transglycosylase domain-containing protein [Candidatus Polarisedimenticolia bacterium]|nr:lytic transglycosylase domain-containing protein [Candidatus Polarisedimenticolia bacterium]